MLRVTDLWGRGCGGCSGVGPPDVSGSKDIRASKRSEWGYRGLGWGSHHEGSCASRLASHCLRAPPGRVPCPECQGMEGAGAGCREPEQQPCLSVIPANKILFHYPHYNWFTAFFVYLSIRAAVKWLGKAIA